MKNVCATPASSAKAVELYSTISSTYTVNGVPTGPENATWRKSTADALRVVFRSNAYRYQPATRVKKPHAVPPFTS